MSRKAIAHTGHERVVVLVEHDEALGRHSALAHVLEAALDHRVDRALQVLVVEHDERAALRVGVPIGPLAGPGSSAFQRPSDGLARITRLRAAVPAPA